MHTMTELLQNIRRLMKFYDNMLKSVSEKYGLSTIETTIISFLYNNPQKDTAADIVELRMLSKGNVSLAVESLIQKSLLTRQQDKTDRRKIHLSLTKNSETITKDITEIKKYYQKVIFDGFTEEELKLFHQFNMRIKSNIESATERGEG